jgi:hypothetical protein
MEFVEHHVYGLVHGESTSAYEHTPGPVQGHQIEPLALLGDVDPDHDLPCQRVLN